MLERLASLNFETRNRSRRCPSASGGTLSVMRRPDEPGSESSIRPRSPTSTAFSPSSINVKLLWVALDGRARFPGKREDVVTSFICGQIDFLQQVENRRVRAHPDVFGLELDDGETGGGQGNADFIRGIFAVVLIYRSFAVVL